MRLSEIIGEGVNDNFLYHSMSSGKTFEKILMSGEIKPNIAEFDADTINSDIPAISVSRSQYTRFPYGDGILQIVLDKNVLKSNGFRVMPINGPLMPHKEETEERIYRKDGKGIPFRLPFIVRIEVRSGLSIPDSVRSKLDELEIPIKEYSKNITPVKKSNQSNIKPDDITIDRMGRTYMLSLGNKILHPYYMVTDKVFIKKSLEEIKDRLAKGEDLETILPKSIDRKYKA